MRVDELIRENRVQVMQRLRTFDRRCGTTAGDMRESEQREPGQFRVGWGDWGAWGR